MARLHNLLKAQFFVGFMCIKSKNTVAKAVFYAIIEVVGNNLFIKLLQNVHSKTQLCAIGGQNWQKCYKRP